MSYCGSLQRQYMDILTAMALRHTTDLDCAERVAEAEASAFAKSRLKEAWDKGLAEGRVKRAAEGEKRWAELNRVRNAMGANNHA